MISSARNDVSVAALTPQRNVSFLVDETSNVMKKKRHPFEEKTNNVCQVETQLQPGVLICTDEHNSCLKEMKDSNGTACILFNSPKST